MDNFNFKQFLMENKLGAYGKAHRLNERQSETGLYVIGRTQQDNMKIGQMIEDAGYHAEWNAREGYWFFPEQPEYYDSLEADLEAELAQRDISARFEGVHNDTKNDYFDLRRKSDY